MNDGQETGFFRGLRTMIFPSTFTPGSGLPGYGTGRKDAECGVAKNTCAVGSYEAMFAAQGLKVGYIEVYDRWACRGLEGGKNVLCKSVKPGTVDNTGHIKTHCHLNKPAGGYLINFNKKLISDRKDSTHTDHHKLSAGIKAGKYKIKLESFDGYIASGERKDRKDTDAGSQSKEQYYVKFQDGNSTIATTQSTHDLKDGVTQDTWIGVVDNELSISKNTNYLTLQHVVPYAGQWKRNPNSLTAVCMSMEPIIQTVDGECGSASSDTVSVDSCSVNTPNLCTKGTPIMLDNNAGPHVRNKCMWRCESTNGGETSSTCSAFIKHCGTTCCKVR